MQVKKKPVKKKPVTVKAPGKRISTSRHDWDSIRTAFIEGVPAAGTKEELIWPTLKDLSESYVIPYIQVRKRAAKERWTETKNANQLIAAQERAKVRARQIEKNALDFDEKSYKAAQLGLAMVTTRLAEVAEEVRVKTPLRRDALQRLERGEHVAKEELYSAIRYSEMQGLASALTMFQELGRKALGTDGEHLHITGDTSTVNVVNVRNEMVKDDPARMAEMIKVMMEAGLMQDGVLSPGEEDEVMDAEVVEQKELGSGETTQG